MLEIRIANKNDIDKVLNLYKTVIIQIKDNKFNPEWKYGIYPKEEHIIDSINSGELYVGQIDSEIVSAIVVDSKVNKGYENINWKINTSDENIYYIHLVVVNQDYKNHGIAKEMLKYTFKQAKRNSIKSIRLSLHKNNMQIENLYKNLGFEDMGSIEIDDEDRGLISFEVYEKLIE